MKKTTRNILIGIGAAIVIGVGVLVSPPNTYYVAATGNDANAGTQTQPWKTLGKANNTVAAGDTIQVQAGTYNQVLVIKKSNLTWIANGKVITKAIEVDGNNNVVRGFTITDPQSKAGIRTTGNFNLIENNEIYHMLEDGIWFWGHDNTFKNNYMHDILAVDKFPGYDEHVDCIMTWDWLWDTYNIVFDGNVCDNNRSVGSNQMIIVTGTRAHDMTFRNNRFIMRDAGYSPFALYGGSNYKLENNYFCNTTGQGSAALYLSGGTGITATNNVYAGYSVFAQGLGIVSQSGNVKDSSPCAVFSSTATQTPTSTATSTLTPTPSATITPALTPTPTAVRLCVKILWRRNLNIRPEPSLYNLSVGYYLYNKIVRVNAIVENSEGNWAQVNDGNYFAMKIGNNEYARITNCP